ncbi:hypothetical protein KG112_08510 [Nocardioides sp. zg-ZUI104]|uniref:hypothetical protein n=1 Tax=Nocardioides faecalis TaxID=2803858 RepID=UPI001BD138AC|nr:hypothetical protein [Nocardioides faecalis]MBS4752846.1 hypothetical protein [Nocardioides faecalis]
MFGSRALVLSTLLATLLAAVLVPPPAQAKPRPGLPPVNPYAGPVGSSTMHGDPASSDTTRYRGPGPGARATTRTLLSVCPTILAGKDGYIQALCTEYLDRAPTLNIIDPTTLRTVARKHLTAGSLLGGVYAYLDHRDRLVTVDGSGRVLFLEHRRAGSTGRTMTITEAAAIDLKPAFTRACGAADCDAVTTVAPGYNGLVWFATAQGRAGYADPRTRKVALRVLGRGEQVANSISTSPAGMAVVTDHATYLVKANRNRAGRPGAVKQVWRRAYDRGPARKPGQLSHGSGATPTFFGPRTGREYVAITDNARPREHLIVYRAATGRTVCKTPILGRANSGTENSAIALRNQVYVASTYGYPYPATPDGAGEAVPAKADFVGGMQRLTLSRKGRKKTCRVRWTNTVASAAVPKLSVAENVIYTVERLAQGSRWDLVRIDPARGRVLSRTTIGRGPTADTLQMVGTFLPDGTLLQGTVTGLVAVRPAPAG